MQSTKNDNVNFYNKNSVRKTEKNLKKKRQNRRGSIFPNGGADLLVNVLPWGSTLTRKCAPGGVHFRGSAFPGTPAVNCVRYTVPRKNTQKSAVENAYSMWIQHFNYWTRYASIMSGNETKWHPCIFADTLDKICTKLHLFITKFACETMVPCATGHCNVLVYAKAFLVKKHELIFHFISDRRWNGPRRMMSCWEDPALFELWEIQKWIVQRREASASTASPDNIDAIMSWEIKYFDLSSKKLINPL